MQKLGDTTALVFIIFLIILAATSILGVWDILEEDVIIKSISTLGVLTFATAILLAYSHYSDSNSGGGSITSGGPASY